MLCVVPRCFPGRPALLWLYTELSFTTGLCPLPLTIRNISDIRYLDLKKGFKNFLTSPNQQTTHSFIFIILFFIILTARCPQLTVTGVVNMSSNTSQKVDGLINFLCNKPTFRHSRLNFNENMFQINPQAAFSKLIKIRNI